MYKRTISRAKPGRKNGDVFSLIKTAEKIQSSLTSGHVIDDVTLMTLIYNLLMYSYLPTHEILFLCVSPKERYSS